jgi:Ser/Thr protein kinase RdoA (MazF antagonist)
MRQVVAFEHICGHEPDQSASLPSWFLKLGTLTARLHRHSRSWKRTLAFQRKTWDFDAMLGARPLWGDWRAGLGLRNPERQLLQKVADALAQRVRTYGQQSQRFGLVHADLRLANLLVDGERLGIIDFDDCGFSWFFYDFAAAVSFIEHEPIVADLQHAWLEGYRTIAPVSKEGEGDSAFWTKIGAAWPNNPQNEKNLPPTGAIMLEAPVLRFCQAAAHPLGVDQGKTV